MCHTWCLGRTPAELRGGQVEGEHGAAQQVAKYGIFRTFKPQIPILSDYSDQFGQMMTVEELFLVRSNMRDLYNKARKVVNSW